MHWHLNGGGDQGYTFSARHIFRLEVCIIAGLSRVPTQFLAARGFFNSCGRARVITL